MDFHPNMLASQRAPVSPTLPNAGRGAFHPNMLGRQQLAGFGAVTPPPAAPPAVSVDWSRGVIVLGGNEIKIVSAILTSVLVKLVFFGGHHAGKAAKRALGKLRSRDSEPAAATNPGSAKPWQAVVFGPHGTRIAQTRCRTKNAGNAFVARHPEAVYSRVSYKG